jgi:hypothetical protein
VSNNTPAVHTLLTTVEQLIMSACTTGCMTYVAHSGQ